MQKRQPVVVGAVFLDSVNEMPEAKAFAQWDKIQTHTNNEFA